MPIISNQLEARDGATKAELLLQCWAYCNQFILLVESNGKTSWTAMPWATGGGKGGCLPCAGFFPPLENQTSAATHPHLHGAVQEKLNHDSDEYKNWPQVLYLEQQ